MPVPARPAPRRLPDQRSIGWVAAVLGGAGLVTGFVIAPPDAVQGEAARLMYLHVPAAWTAYLAFGVVLVGSIGYLRSGNRRWDRAAQAAAEIGVALGVLTIALGSVWGRAAWGVWWAWDPRIVSTVLLVLLYAGYLAGRRVGADPCRAARRSAVAGIAGVALVPVVHFSVVWWRSLHQRATILAPDPDPPIDPMMLTALTLCVAAFTVAGTWLFLRRLAQLRQSDKAPEDTVVPPALVGEQR
ncbi:cytochrome c biogenesis protein CcsA [Amycolatopsis thermoflava]|uniref:cytochrome c biogenesis protein CcsA n=1 Tax=Amycolatopsis thermoflava TaxID=84480 RepID=UPI003EB75F3F